LLYINFIDIKSPFVLILFFLNFKIILKKKFKNEISYLASRCYYRIFLFKYHNTILRYTLDHQKFQHNSYEHWYN